MKERSTRVLILAVAVIAIALPAAAEVYTVTLTNGASFETRYEPLRDPDDDGKLLILTDLGNWISLKSETVTGVTSNTETRGFGLVIDSKTVFLGFTSNDLEEAESGQPTDPMARLLEYFEGQDSREPYSVQQFVEPEEAGGIPVGFANRTTPPIGGVGNR